MIEECADHDMGCCINEDGPSHWIMIQIKKEKSVQQWKLRRFTLAHSYNTTSNSIHNFIRYLLVSSVIDLIPAS